ncbi:MAG: protein kinase domain-containing protein [Candidatus Xenobia bacterium]
MGAVLAGGEKLGGTYEVVGLLSQQPLANVYNARDTSGKQWIVQEIPLGEVADKEVFLAAYRQVLEQLLMIDHPNLPHLGKEVVITDNAAYVVHERPQGQTIEEILSTSNQPLTEQRVKRWTTRLMDLLNFLHNQDPPIYLAPFFTRSLMIPKMHTAAFLSEPDTLHVRDYAPLRFYPDERQRQENKLSLDWWMPPELKTGQPADARTDVYAVGVLMHHMLTRWEPEAGQKPVFPGVRQTRPDVSEVMEGVIATAVQADPEKRFPDVESMKETLGQVVAREEAVGKLELDVDKIVLSDVRHGEVVSGEFQVRNTGGGQLTARIKPDVEWVTVTPDRVATMPSAVKYSIDTGKLEPGRIHTGHITVLTGSGNVSIPVQLSISGKKAGAAAGTGGGSATFGLVLLPLVLVAGAFYGMVAGHTLFATAPTTLMMLAAGVLSPVAIGFMYGQLDKASARNLFYGGLATPMVLFILCCFAAIGLHLFPHQQWHNLLKVLIEFAVVNVLMTAAIGFWRLS